MAQSNGARSDPPIEETLGMRTAFWSWAAIVVVGLTAMIAIPLAGR
jgi:hypothetical protein